MGCVFSGDHSLTFGAATVRERLYAIVDGAMEPCLDDAAVRRSLEQHHLESYGWAMACCRHSRDEAENVLQIAYVKVLTHRAVFDGRSSFRTWLFAVIRRTAAEERRSELFRRLRLERWFGGASEAGPSGEDLAVSRQAGEQLRRALAKLPARQREVLHLVFYHNLSLEEAARIMGVGIGSARTHYERGKKQMRRYLGVER